ncbi:MAG TPA: hypothetical protein VEI97_10535 [bacterium]|nr:hypothetical protein [bacterium]
MSDHFRRAAQVLAQWTHKGGVWFKAGTNFLGKFTHANTADRTWTFPDKDGTVAMTSDITASTQPSVRVYYAAGSQSIATSTVTTLTFDTESYDTDTLWAGGAPTRITFTTAGKYAVFGHARFASNTTGQRQLLIRLDGTTNIASVNLRAGSTDVTDVAIYTEYVFTAGQYVELQAHQDSGGNLDVQTSGVLTPVFGASRTSA